MVCCLKIVYKLNNFEIGKRNKSASVRNECFPLFFFVQWTHQMTCKTSAHDKYWTLEHEIFIQTYADQNVVYKIFSDIKWYSRYWLVRKIKFYSCSEMDSGQQHKMTIRKFGKSNANVMQSQWMLSTEFFWINSAEIDEFLISTEIRFWTERNCKNVNRINVFNDWMWFSLRIIGIGISSFKYVSVEWLWWILF